MFYFVVAFYITCILFVVIVLGTILKLVTGVNIFTLLKYLGARISPHLLNILVGGGAAASYR